MLLNNLPRTLSSTFHLPRNATLCLLRLSAIGDVCHAISVVDRIRRQRPDIRITWVIGVKEYALLEGMQGIEFVVYDKARGNVADQQVKQQLSDREFDVLCIMQVALRANLLSRMVKAKIRLGFDRKHSKEGHSFFINRRIPTLHQPHVLEGFHAFADALGIASEEQLTWSIAYSQKDEQFAKTLIADSLPTIAICAAASKLERCWNAKKYAEIAQYCIAIGYRVVLCGGPGKLDENLATQIQSHCNQPLSSFVGKTSLKQMYYLLKQVVLAITPDTGLAHLSTAAGTPVVGLYAHSNPRRTGPYYALNYVVNAYDEHILQQHGKPWQKLKWGVRAKGPELMDDISVERVKTMITSILGKP